MMKTIYEPARSVEEILITKELYQRKARLPDGDAEALVYARLVEKLTENSDVALNALVKTGVELCSAGSCGLSVMERTPSGEQIFRWTHMAGVYKEYVGGTTPREFSPCGTTLDRRAPQLFYYPARLFTYFQAVEPPIVEGLVLPLVFDNAPLGTIWIVSHDEERQFDVEDVRVMTAIAYFTVALLRIHDESALPFAQAG
jgi:hypothetical protein